MENLDLDRHAVVEASAGTGKTYTLEHLVRRLLRAKKVTLDQVLLVTFTEKATGELKSRIRANLEDALSKLPNERDVFRAALDQVDQMNVYTIHGFCQRILQEFAFEHGQDFTPQLVDDRGLLPLCLREIQRRDWPGEHGGNLCALLERAGFRDGNPEYWEKPILELAGRYRPACGHRLLPEPAGDWHAATDGEEFKAQFVVHTVVQLQQHLAQHKRERGLRSYDDMLQLMDRGLDPARNRAAPLLLRRLRARYRYAIVDEFQDTDLLQWRIFKRLFVDGAASRLVIVGDPKQAIFGFRGADLHAYLHAVAELKQAHAASEMQLDVNWRSSPQVLHALNVLFEKGDWFANSGITYHPVHAPEDARQPNKLVEDRSERPAVTLVDCKGKARLLEARALNARFVAAEIRRLLGLDGSGPLLDVQVKGQPARPLEAGDIAILIMKHPESRPLIKALRRLRIPFSYYKQRGLWQSDEVNHLVYMLRALARPEDRAAFHKALLTRFFRIRPEELAACDDLPPFHPVRKLFQDWVGLAESRAWSSLFQALLEESGVIYHDARDAEGGERRLANYRHILATLEQAAYAQSLDLLGIVDLLEQKRRQPGGDDGDLQPIETERPKVRIMTVHAAKGLEFPVVFLAGGFTGRAAGSYVTYRDDAGNTVFDVRKDSDSKERAAAEREQEERRLLYVALTRAMFKLYVPVASGKKMPGPLVTILFPALEKSEVEGLGQPWVERLSPAEQASKRARGRSAPRPGQPALEIAELFPQAPKNLFPRRIQVRSFSSLHRRDSWREIEEPSFAEREARADDDPAETLAVPDPLRGPVFGDIVHNVLENMDFADVGQAGEASALLVDGHPFRRVLDAELARSLMKVQTRLPAAQLEEAARRQIAGLVWNTLQTPLAEAGAPLWQVPAHDRIHEVEFHFPEADLDASAETPPAEVRRTEGFLTGFMDLVFRRDGRYFLVDWKTNLLDAYTPEALDRAMEEADYLRQYRLYLQALKRWLRRQDASFDFLRDFGGVYYLFLRGMNGKDEDSGVFFTRPREADLLLETVLEQYNQ